MKKQIALCTLGTIFEWYEFSLYACLSPILAQIFFKDSHHATALMATFVIFASGYLMRPLGAVFFGQLGDRYGRKYTLVITIFAMTFATTAIGMIPTGATSATVMLIICRLIQGFATSGEYPGGLTLLAEQGDTKRPAFISSFGIFGTGAGCFSGALAYFILLQTLGMDAILQWGWRIPFLLGAPLGVIGYLLRRYSLESPEFIALQATKTTVRVPVIDLFRHHSKALMVMLSISIFTNALTYITFLYFGTTLASQHKLTSAEVIYVNLMITFVYSLSILLFGWIADWVNKKTLLVCGCLAMLVSAHFIVMQIMLGGITAIFSGLACLAFLIGMVLGPFASILPQHFPAAIRYTGVSVTLNFAAAFFGSSAPMICHWLSTTTGSVLAPSMYMIVLAGIASMGGLTLLMKGEQDHAMLEVSES